MQRTDGFFYVIQLAPDIQPKRLKLGWSADPLRRLQDFRIAAPTAVLLQMWPCHRRHEARARRGMVTLACTYLGEETVDCDDVDRLLARGNAFFVWMNLYLESGGIEQMPLDKTLVPPKRLDGFYVQSDLPTMLPPPVNGGTKARPSRVPASASRDNRIARLQEARTRLNRLIGEEMAQLKHVKLSSRDKWRQAVERARIRYRVSLTTQPLGSKTAPLA